ncbi:MAG: ribosome recycling factor [Chitinophagales bacterium]|nr:ribosome recycling factor [Chitinophagales bacterium]
MDEEVQFIIDETKESMQKALKHLEEELRRVRAGKASPDMVSAVRVEYYGMPTPIQQVASVKMQDAKTLLITPFERGLINDIERALFQANLGITPQNDGENIRLVIPLMTEDRRRELVKQSKVICENTKLGIRSARKDGNDEIKSLTKDGLSEDVSKDAEITIQNLTNQYIDKVDKMLTLKEEEIMTI